MLLFLSFLSFGCDTVSPEQPLEYKSDPKGIHTFQDFTQAFPEQFFPFDHKGDSAIFETANYEQLPDSLVIKYLRFEAWTMSLPEDPVTFYPVGRWDVSDTACYLLYLIEDSIPQWHVKNMNLVHVTMKGELLGSFPMFQEAHTSNHPILGSIDIMQTASLHTADSGSIHILTRTTNAENWEENHNFAVAQDGSIDSEYVIKD